MKMAGTLLLAGAGAEAILLGLSIVLGVTYARNRPSIAGVIVLATVGIGAVAATGGLGWAVRGSAARRPRWLGLESWWLGVVAGAFLFWVLMDVDAILLFGSPIPAAP